MFINKQTPTSDLSAPRTLINHFAPGRSICGPWITVLFASLFYAVSAAAWAKHASWHQYSESYEVHLGVIPASVADRDSTLIQMHKIAPHGNVNRTDALRHIMVAVFRRPGMERVFNIDISAEVIESDLIHTRSEKKKLDLMMLPGGVSYCNFFTLHWNGIYEIKLRILEPGKGTEWVTFYQEEMDLPG